MLRNSLKVLLFPGQGSQHVGMCKYTLEDNVHGEWSTRLVDNLSSVINKDLKKLMLNGPQNELELTENAQPAIFANAYVSFMKYQRESAAVTAASNNSFFTHAIGNSVGEYTALVAAGCITPETAVGILAKRGRLMQEACEGKKCGMLAVLTSDVELVQGVIDGVREESADGKESSTCCCVAVFASNKQLVLSGEQAPLKRVQEVLKKSKRIVSVFLPVSAAFHCNLLTKMKPEFKKILEQAAITAPPMINVIRNIDLKEYATKEDIIEGLVEQLDRPVLFRQSIDYILGKVDVEQLKGEPEIRTTRIQFVEAGTTGLLTKLARDVTIQANKQDIVEFVNVY